MIAPGDIVAAGVSGGADSVCLFLMLCELAEEMDFRLIAVHVNHGIREEAGRDAAYVEGLCAEKGIPFVLVKEDVRDYARRERISEEEAGRVIRYRAFEEALGNYAGVSGGKIAVAHNANDRAETMLFHLFRGTGLAGIGGIKPVRGQIIRPLLCLERREIEEYLAQKQVPFCIDHTNLEDTYTRNRIRNHILSYAEKEICKGAVSHMCEAADVVLEAEGYLKEKTDGFYQECVLYEDAGRITLDTACLSREGVFLQKQVFLKALGLLTEGRKDITSVHIREIAGLLDKTGSRRISLPYGLEARKEYGRLILCRKEKKEEDTAGAEQFPIENIPVKVEIPGLGMAEFRLLLTEKGEKKIIPEKSYTKWFDYDKITKSLMFRTRETGDYLTINKSLSRKSLKEYMIGEKIPRNQREKIYVLADGSHIVWMPGYRISEYYKVSEETERILQVQIRGGL